MLSISRWCIVTVSNRLRQLEDVLSKLCDLLLEGMHLKIAPWVGGPLTRVWVEAPSNGSNVRRKIFHVA